MSSLICPKPRRVGLLNPSINDAIRPLRWLSDSQQSDFGDSKAETELLDIIFTKGTENICNQVASSPPYFCGSPPTRSSNPLTQDAQFDKEKLALLTTAPASPSSLMGGGGCVRVKFGHKPVLSELKVLIVSAEIAAIAASLLWLKGPETAFCSKILI